MVAPIRFLSGRQQQQKIGIEGSTENEKVLEVVGRVGIGTTIFDANVELEVRGDVNISGVLTAGNFSVTGVSTFTSDLDINASIDVDGHTELDNLNVSGVSTFASNVDINASIDVDGHTELDELNVSGVSTFASDLDINASVDISNDLNVSGVSTFTSDLDINASVDISNDLNVSGVSTFASDLDINSSIDVDGHTELDNLNVSGVSTFIGAITGTISTATKLETARTFEITGDVVASPISFDGTGNVSFAATIQPNSVALGTDTFGNYVKNISGTANEIDVTGGTGEGSTPVISFAPNPTIGGNVTIGNDLQVNNNLNVTGNITVGGTAGYILVNEFRVTDADIILGFTTDISGNDVSNDTTANHGGIAVASTEGNPLVTLVNPGAGETLPATYKKIMWFKAGSFAGLNTDAWLSNYAIGIGSTQFPSGTRLAAGAVQITENDLAVVRNINASGIVTSPTFVGNLTGTASTASNLTRNVIAGDGLTGGGELTADRTLNIGVGTGITVNVDDIQLRNSDNLTNNTITKWDDGNGQLTNSLITDDGSIVNVGSAVTIFTSTGIISATAYYGSGGNLEDIIKNKIEGFTGKFKPYNSGITTLGDPLRIVDLEIFDNSTTGFITAVGFGSTAQYYFNDVTAVGLTTDASVNTTGVITAYGFEVAGGGVFTGDGSGLTNLAGVAAGVTVTNNDSLIGTVSVLNFGPNIDVSAISAGVVTFSLNGNQNFTGIVTASSLNVTGVSTFAGIVTTTTDLYVGGDLYVQDDLVFDSFSANSFDITNSASIGGNLGVGTTNPTSKLQVEDLGIDVTVTEVSTTAATTIDSFSTSSYRSSRFQVQITQGTDYQASDILVVHNDSVASLIEYGTVVTNDYLGEFETAISGGNCILQVLMSSADPATIKVSRYSINK